MFFFFSIFFSIYHSSFFFFTFFSIFEFFFILREVWCSCGFELSVVSWSLSSRKYCGYWSGSIRVMLSSRQDDGDLRAPAVVCIVCVVVHVVAGGRVRWWLFFGTLCLSVRTPPRTTPVERMSDDLAVCASTHQLVRNDTALLLLLGSHSSGIQFLTAFCPSMAFWSFSVDFSTLGDCCLSAVSTVSCFATVLSATRLCAPTSAELRSASAVCLAVDASSASAVRYGDLICVRDYDTLSIAVAVLRRLPYE